MVMVSNRKGVRSHGTRIVSQQAEVSTSLESGHIHTLAWQSTAEYYGWVISVLHGSSLMNQNFFLALSPSAETFSELCLCVCGSFYPIFHFLLFYLHLGPPLPPSFPLLLSHKFPSIDSLHIESYLSIWFLEDSNWHRKPTFYIKVMLSLCVESSVSWKYSFACLWVSESTLMKILENHGFWNTLFPYLGSQYSRIALNHFNENPWLFGL